MNNGNGSTAITRTTTEETSLAVQAQFGEMSVAMIVTRKKKIVEVMEAVMKEGEHYGKIPGCGDKPSLFKAGAEVLATVFGLAPQLDVRRNDLAGGHREYEVTCTLIHIATGAVVGQGVGCCSTMESKYRWRKGERKCPNCGKATIIKGQAQYGGGWVCWDKKGGCKSKWRDGAKEIEDQNADKVENPDIADVYNTVLKMAKKRAQVDCTLTAVGASDILTQDLDDLRDAMPATTIDPADQDIDTRPPAQQRTNGNGSRSQQQSRPAPPDDPKIEAAAMDLIADLADAHTPEEVRSLAPRFNALPKGSRARASAREAYDKRLTEVSAPGAA